MRKISGNDFFESSRRNFYELGDRFIWVLMKTTVHRRRVKCSQCVRFSHFPSESNVRCGAGGALAWPRCSAPPGRKTGSLFRFTTDHIRRSCRAACPDLSRRAIRHRHNEAGVATGPTILHREMNFPAPLPPTTRSITSLLHSARGQQPSLFCKNIK